MTTSLRTIFLFLFTASLFSMMGCTSEEAQTEVMVNSTDSEAAATESTDTTEPKEFELGDLIPDFTPPTFEQVNGDTEWLDKPVVDVYQLMTDRKENEVAMLTVAEALALRNNTAEDNDKIVSAMGTLAVDGEVNYDAQWVRHTAADIRSTNPLMASSSAEFDVSGLLNLSLFTFDWNFTPYGNKDAITSWRTSSDGLMDIVTIRSDLTWSDGTKLTAYDVEYSYQVIMSSAVPIPAVRSGTDQLKGVKAYDEHTLIYFHAESLATNIWNMLFPIIPKHKYENTISDDPTLASSTAHVELDENPVTAGAYTIQKRERNQEIVLKRRDSYYTFKGEQVRQKPHFETVRFKIIEDPNTALLSMKKGELEEMMLTPEQWKSQTDGDEFYEFNTKSYALEWVYYYFGWNFRSPFFKDKRVRQAMSYAFNHQELLEKHRFGMDEASTGIFHHTSPWAPEIAPTAYQQDLDKAEELLAEAGWEDTDADGILDNVVELDNDFDGVSEGEARRPFEFTILTSNRPDRIAICTLLQENLDQIGIRCNVKPVEFTTLQETMLGHKFHAVFAGWGTGADPDTSENLWTTKAIDNGRNYGCYSNPEVDKLFEQGKRELDLEQRRKVYQQIHMKLWEDQPYTWLFFRNAYYGFNKSLRGYNYSPRGPYNYGPGESTIFKPAAMQ
ncbi:MAG: peptide ABC transporter substrate-binding protein [Planctomycetaceae bacterium]|nr:peptide ABC transporter substrate-binding protein [Planctomycetaceae bacterium]